MAIASDVGNKNEYETQNRATPRIVVADSLNDLLSHEAAWRSLAKSTVVPNVYYEPHLLVPAVKHFSSKGTLRFVFVYDSSPDGELIGFFPLEFYTKLKRIPFKYARLWQYEYCYLCTPLVRRGFEQMAVTALFDDLTDRSTSCNGLKMEHFSAEGPFLPALLSELAAHKTPFWRSKRFSSMLLKPESSWAVYQQNHFSKNLRKQIRKCQKKFDEHESFEHVYLSPNDDVDIWIEEFLQLESSGWKQQIGSAMACERSTREFFRDVARIAFAEGSLSMSMLQLDGKTIAMNCDFLAGEAAFCFKSAFDEDFSAYSPGLYLDWCLLRDIHENGQIRWFDSCSAPNHPVLSRLWNETQTIESYWCSTGTISGNVMVWLLPQLKRITKRRS